MKATCTWGDGPDIALDLDGTRFVLYEDPKHNKPPQGDYVHGYVQKGSIDLTMNEAEELGRQLISAAENSRRLYESANDFDPNFFLDFNLDY